MIVRRTLFSLSLLAGAVGGCATHTDGPIDYEVTGGFTGTGDGTVLHIELDGTTVRSRPSGGTETVTLDAVTLGDLRRKIGEAQFPSLAPIYHCQCADDYVHNVSVDLDGTTYAVSADTMAPIPDRLKSVIDALKHIYSLPLEGH